jgi:NitT/TauT family transport system substrate-binding protein
MKSTTKKILGSLAVLGLFLTTDMASSQERPLTKITLAYGAINANVSPIWVARDQGFFAKHGLDPHATFIVAGRAAQAMLAGEVQIGLMGPTHVVSAAASGGDLVLLMSFRNQLEYLFIAKSEIKAPQDLKGKKLGVATPAGSASLATYLVLERFGLETKRDQITLVNVGGEPERFASFLSGAVDATVLAPEILEKLSGHPHTVLLDLGKSGVPWQHTAIAVRRSYQKANPAVVEGTLKALLEAVAFIHKPSNKPSVMKVLTKELKLSNEHQAEVAYRELTGGLPKKPYPTREGISSAIQLMTRLKINPKAAEVKAEDVIDLEPLRRLEPFMESLVR